MKSIYLAHKDLKNFPELKVKDVVKVSKYLGMQKFALSNGDIVVYLSTNGLYLSQLDGYSVYDVLIIFNSETERIEKQIGMIKLR